MNRLGGEAGLPLVVVDYAHTPDALEQALGLAARAYRRRADLRVRLRRRARSRQAPADGGDRRALADRVIVTDDNPRNEDGDAIVADIVAGFADAARVAGAARPRRRHRTGVGHARARGHGAGCRQGPRAVPGSRRRPPCVRRHWRSPAICCVVLDRSVDGDEAVCADRSGSPGHRAALRRPPGRCRCAWSMPSPPTPVHCRVAMRCSSPSRARQFDGHAHVARRPERRRLRGRALVARERRHRRCRRSWWPTPSARWRPSPPRCSATRSTRTVLAITGSNGKTSVKTLLLSILQQVGSAYASPGNRNNEIGLPLAVLDAPDDARNSRCTRWVPASRATSPT
jgi:hypothetical protein